MIKLSLVFSEKIGKVCSLRPKLFLQVKFREIQVYFTHTKNLLPNSPVGNLWIDVDTRRRVHHDWVTNVREVGPDKLAYHVLVHDADEEVINYPSLQCSPIPDLHNKETARTYEEPHVIFKLMRVKITKQLILEFPSSTIVHQTYEEGKMNMKVFYSAHRVI